MLPDDTGELFFMNDFYEIDLWQLDAYSVEELTTKQILKLYPEVVEKLSHKDYLRIRTKEYWIVRDRYKSRYDKMKLLIYCYVLDNDGEDVNWNHILEITPDERKKPSALKPFQDEL